MKLKGVIFDFNGVLVDDYPIQKEAWIRISQELRGLPVSDQEMIQKIRGVPTRDTLRWMNNKGLPQEEIENLAKKKDKIVQMLCDTSPLFCLNIGLEKLLGDLRERNIPITIATSSREDIFLFAFNKLGLERWFDRSNILYNDGTYPGKPAPDPYILAAKKIELKTEECYVFEDAKSGIQSAYSAGVVSIIAVGNDERLTVLRSMPGVIRGIHNFSEITADQLFPNSGNNNRDV